MFLAVYQNGMSRMMVLVGFSMIFHFVVNPNAIILEFNRIAWNRRGDILKCFDLKRLNTNPVALSPRANYTD
jgi:hypothetical protein